MSTSTLLLTYKSNIGNSVLPSSATIDTWVVSYDPRTEGKCITRIVLRVATPFLIYTFLFLPIHNQLKDIE